jgi:hypothetical protein
MTLQTLQLMHDLLCQRLQTSSEALEVDVCQQALVELEDMIETARLGMAPEVCDHILQRDTASGQRSALRASRAGETRSASTAPAV